MIELALAITFVVLATAVDTAPFNAGLLPQPNPARESLDLGECRTSSVTVLPPGPKPLRQHRRGASHPAPRFQVAYRSKLCR